MESIGENSDCFYAQRILPSVFMYDFSCFFLILSLIKSVNSLFKGYSQILILNPFFMGLFHIIHLMRLHYRCHWSRMESSYSNRAFLLICFAILLTLALFMENLSWLISCAHVLSVYSSVVWTKKKYNFAGLLKKLHIFWKSFCQ